MQVNLKKQILKLVLIMLILVGMGLLVANQGQAITLTAHLYKQMNWDDEHDCWKWELPDFSPEPKPKPNPGNGNGNGWNNDGPGNGGNGNGPGNGGNGNGHNDTAPVPEPATMVLLGTGMIAIAAVKRKLH